MGYSKRNPSLSPLMEQVMIALDQMWLYFETQTLLSTTRMMALALEVGLCMFFSYGTMEHGSRYKKSPPQMKRLVIGSYLVRLYPATLLPLGSIGMMIGH